MVENVSLWHVTPVHLGTEFFDSATSVLEANEDLYTLVNHSDIPVAKVTYAARDYESIKEMREFLDRVKNNLKSDKFSNVSFCDAFPGIVGCIAKFRIASRIFCYVMYNGTAVFIEYGEDIPFADEKHFSLPVFLERQRYEDEYCQNREATPMKKPVYDFLELMWKCKRNSGKYYSSSKAFRNNGISYTLCMTMINDPSLRSNSLDEGFVKNVNALLDTSPFNNVYDEEQWPIIETRIDEYTVETPQIKELSENLIFADSWSGVVVAGDLHRNRTCLTWLMEFEIVLQSTWLLFDAYCENILRQDLSVIDLQSILSRVEFMKVSLDNDISSNMEQSRHVMRNSLIASSDINIIYSRMHGMLESRLKIQIMKENKTKAKYSLLSDIALLAIAIMEIYGVIVELLSAESFGKTEVFAMMIMMAIAGVCIWAMVKGRE